MKVQKQIEWDSRLWCANAWGRSNDHNSGLYRYICYRYGITFHSFSYTTSFDAICKLAIIEIKAKGPVEPIFDYIIVDESQDFDSNFEELCKLVTKNQVYMAGDVFQSIFAEHIAKAYNADYLLGKCYRTAPDTLMFAHALGLGLFEKKRYRWLEDDDWTTCGYKIEHHGNQMTITREPNTRFDGDDIDYESIKLGVRDKYTVAQVVCAMIEEMRKENDGRLSPDDLAIIFLDDNNDIYLQANQICVALNDRFQWEGNKGYESKEPIEGTVLISNRYNVKGLEYPYVICITEKLQDNHLYRNALYTMLTRSFIRSYMLFSDSTYTIPTEIKNGLLQIKQNHSMAIEKANVQEIEEIGISLVQAKKALSLSELVEIFVTENNIDKSNMPKILDVFKAAEINLTDNDSIMEQLMDIAKMLRLIKR